MIHIYLNGIDHYDAITKVTGFLGVSYYCEYCDVEYSQRGVHSCADGCEDCYSDIPCIRGEKIRCMDCKRTFHSRDCLVNINLSNLSSINLFVNLCIIVVNVELGSWVQRKIMFAQDRENVGIVKRLLDPIINATFKVVNVNLR